MGARNRLQRASQLIEMPLRPHETATKYSRFSGISPVQPAECASVS
jgi:hypothetical protein